MSSGRGEMFLKLEITLSVLDALTGCPFYTKMKRTFFVKLSFLRHFDSRSYILHVVHVCRSEQE
jgi:hypothetical protein